jgi:hypothetical protein
MIKGIEYMYAIDQSKLRESKTFSSLRNLQNLLLVVSQEVMSDVYVLSVTVFNRIIRQADCTLIVT